MKASMLLLDVITSATNMAMEMNNRERSRCARGKFLEANEANYNDMCLDECSVKEACSLWKDKKSLNAFHRSVLFWSKKM